MPLSHRTERVAEQLREEVSQILQTEVADPGVGLVTVTRVKVTPDLSLARVYWSLLGDAAERKKTAAALKRAAPFVRHLLAERLTLRRVPEVQFLFDEGLAAHARVEEILHELHEEEAARRIVVSSHERPDGDAIGSGMALTLALRALGKDARMVMCDVPPAYLLPFPGVAGLWIAREVTERFDAAVIMECSDLTRTGVAGLDRSLVVNIDHHPGNPGYGALNWVDESAAACGELAYTLVRALGAPLTADIATHVYLAILTDTGSFRFSHLSPRTFDIAARCVEAGADPEWIARTHYDSNRMARVRLFGSVLSRMIVGGSGRTALLTITPEMAADAEGSYDDTEGLINFPLSVKDVQAVAFFKQAESPAHWRVSLRSKGGVNVGHIAEARGGGGHRNAAACSIQGPLDTLQAEILRALEDAVSASGAEP